MEEKQNAIKKRGERSRPENTHYSEILRFTHAQAQLTYTHALTHTHTYTYTYTYIYIYIYIYIYNVTETT